MAEEIDGKSLLFDNRYLRKLIVPLMIETLLSVTIGMMDTIMVSTVGEHAVSGVSLVDAVANLFIFLFSAFATGGAVVASQYLGRKDRQSACFSAKQLMYLSSSFSIAVSLLLLLFQEPFMRMVYGSVEESVMSSALAYFTPIVLSFPFLAVLNSANALFRSMGKSSITMTVSIIMNLINVTGNAILINVVGLGAMGAGIASLLSRAIACLFMIYRITRQKEEIHIEKPLSFQPDFPMMRKIMHIALPSGIENSIFHIGKVLVSSTVASFGTASIAANAVFNGLSTFANIPGTAVGMAAVTVIGQCCGARDYSAASFYGKKLMKLTYMMNGVTCLVMFILTPELALLYSLSDEAYGLAVKTIRLNMFQTFLFWPPAFMIPNYLRAAGDARCTMFVSIVSMWIFRVIFSKILGVYLGMGFMGVCWGVFLDWYCRGICFAIRFKRGAWKKKAVI